VTTPRPFGVTCVVRGGTECVVSWGLLACVALVLAGCSGPKAPLNPPRLVMSDQTDMAIQLFVQATILLANYYHFETMPYAEFQTRTARGGFNALPFMPPETVRATPELVEVVNVGDSRMLTDFVVQKFGYKALVKYYIRTGLRAFAADLSELPVGSGRAKSISRIFAQEFGVGYALASGVLSAVHANATLSNAIPDLELSRRSGHRHLSRLSLPEHRPGSRSGRRRDGAEQIC